MLQPVLVSCCLLLSLVCAQSNLFSPSDSSEEAAAAAVASRETSIGPEPPSERVSGLRAVYDSATGTIRLEWSDTGGRKEPYSIEYRVVGADGERGEWHQAHPTAQTRPDGGGERSALLDIPTESIRDGDEILVRMKSSAGEGAYWGESLTIAIEKRSPQSNDYGDGGAEAIVVDEGDLVPPLNFTANVLSPTTVRLDWSPAEISGGEGPLYYILAVKKLSGATDTAANQARPQEIRVEGISFLLGSLHAGESYEITVKTATSPERVSSAAAIVEISMPRADEFFEVGNLIITSRFKSDGSGVVNLTWEVPPTMQRRISAYDVQYTRSDRPNSWRQIHFPHSSPTAMLYDLQADSEYLLKIKTLLEENLQTESGEFRFRTPRVEVNPISKLDVIYSSDTRAVRLQWILGPHVPFNNIAGYDVYLSESDSRPEREWRHVGVSGSDPQVAVDGLSPQTTYFARVSVRNKDGTMLKSPSIYKFTTIEHLPPQQQHYRQQHHSRGLSTRSVVGSSRLPTYSNVDKGTALIEWRDFSTGVGQEVTGARVYYTEQSAQLPLERWQQVRVGDTEQRSILLVGLREHTVYNVKVVPTLVDGESAMEATQSFRITSGNWRSVEEGQKMVLDIEDVGFDTRSPALSTNSHGEHLLHVRIRKGTKGKRTKEEAEELKHDASREGDEEGSCLSWRKPVYLRTWGCSHNNSDSEYMAGLLLRAGYQLTGDEDDAALWLLNSCTVKTPSESQLHNRVVEARRRGKRVVVAGCVGQASPGEPWLAGISLIGVQQIDRVVEVVDETLRGSTVRFLSKRRQAPLPLDMPKMRRNEMIEIMAINSGCLNHCTYCKTKQARGDLRSFPLEELVQHAKEAFETDGCRELWLTSEDLGAWGRDIGLCLPDLLNRLVEVVPEGCMMRLGMTNPPYILDYLEEVAAVLRHPRVYSFLHIPVQSGSDAVLSDMRREYTREHFCRIVDYMREHVPGVYIATDFICAFPTETVEDFEESMELVRRYQFPSLFINQFYPRPGTPAARLKRVENGEARRRTREMSQLFHSYSRYSEERIGGIEDVLICEKATDNYHYVGHNKCYEHILLPPSNDSTNLMGKWCRVRITEVAKFHMKASLVEMTSGGHGLQSIPKFWQTNHSAMFLFKLLLIAYVLYFVIVRIML